MEKRVVEKLIPSKVVRIVTYIASDGKVFDSEEACKRHEEYNQVLLHPVFRYSRFVTTWPDEYGASIHYISNKEDHDFLILHSSSGARRGVDEFEKHGTGYYLLYRLDGGDSADIYDLLYLETYLHEITSEFANWIASINHEVDSITNQRKGDSDT